MKHPSRLHLSLWILSALVAGCGGGGGGGGGGGSSSFQVNGLSIQNGSVWEINREIVITFTEPVDFTTVSANTINIRSSADVPATGVFTLRDPVTVVFQPTCPTLDDYSDAGLQPGGVTYTLRVAGKNSSQNTVRSVNGVPVGVQQTRTFSTPASTLASLAFRDTTQGPPVPIVRAQGSVDPNATYIEVGGDPDNRVYFESVGGPTPVLSIPGFEVPLNLYSDLASRVAVMIVFNQPVSPSSTNVSSSRLFLEYLDSTSTWRRIDTRVQLAENCTETGSIVRLEPIGVLPAASAFRAVVQAGFQDLVGEAVQSTQRSFAVAPTRTVEFSSLTPADIVSDEVNEGFSFGGTDPLSFEDTTALFDTPVADWGQGRLSAAFSFDGSGGPNGDFDWVVRPGELFFFDTTSTPIIGGPNGVPTTTLNSVNGVVDVRNFVIEAGGEVRVQGPNPMRINATGDVRILGRLDLSGFSAKDVATLNTGNQIEIGGAGTAGGGRGGSANENTSGPSPTGGRGQGPFRQANLGGEGGEMGFSTTSSKNARRPGGGGGGRFAKDWVGTLLYSAPFSMEAGAGNDGNSASTGALTQTSPAAGGPPGLGAFVDSTDGNDFFGVRPVIAGGQLAGLIRGELPSLWAGYGGGGGGNAGRNYPNPNWNFNSDEKGGGGGGGAGGVHIKALGRIVFGVNGEILANGGRGATGENTNFLDHIGGTGGGGSGGHVILESATLVDFTDGGTNLDPDSRDVIIAGGPVRKSGPLGDVDGCCKLNSNGGPGGPGVIQIHVPDPISPPSDMIASGADIIVPTHALALGTPLDEVTSPPAYVMIPTFGARSKVRSKWISIGGADQRPGGSVGLVQFLFDGIETSGPDAGKIRTAGSAVVSLDPLVSEAALTSSTNVRILADGFTVEFKGGALDAIRAGSTNGISNDIYLRTPSLLNGCAIRMQVGVTPNLEDFDIASAVYDEGTATPGDEALRVAVTTERGRLDAFNPGNQNGTTALHLIPRFFRAITNGLSDSIPTTAFVKLRFQATGQNVSGAPDDLSPLLDWTSDISEFNALPAGALKFFRYEVEFDLDAAAQGVTSDTEPVVLDYLKIPFVF